MEIYYFIHYGLLLSCIFYFISKKSQNRTMILWCVFLTIIGGIRWRTGGDIEQYYDHFLFSKWSNIFNYDRYGNGAETLEPGFVFINVLIKTLLKEFYIYNFIICGFIQYSIYRFCREFFPDGALLVFILIQDLGITYFPVRAGLAVGVCYWAWKYIREQNLKKFLIVVVAAYLIHNQSIVLLPCYWLGRIHMKDWMLLVIYPVIAVFGYVLQDQITLLAMSMGGSLAEKLYFYTQNETDGFAGNSYIGWALNYFFLIVYIYLRKKRNLMNDSWYNCLLNTFIVYNAVYMIFSDGMGDLSRLAGVLFPAQVILLFTSLFYFYRMKNIVYSLGAAMFYLAYLLYKIPAVWSGYYFKDGCVPFKTIFDYNIL